MNATPQSFLGRYRLVKVLGQGAMGVVYEAVDTRLNRSVAIKTVLRTHLVDEATASEYASRFEREAQAAARLSHPNVVAVYDFGEHEEISYIVMEFIRGRELNQAFESGEKFPLTEAVRIMCELLAALDYAHQQGIVHRDVKPANVMLDAGDRVKLTDFGVARVVNANQDRTMPGTLVGTPSYMSPEQILGTAVGSRTDLFAAGVILYQFLVGRRPFTGGGPFGVQRKIVQDDPEPPSKANPEVPQGFDLIIARALAKQPEDRYESAAAFAADLKRLGATLQRALPLIDLDLADEPAAAAAPAAPAPAAAPGPALTFGAAPNADAAPPAPAVPASSDDPPFDPEATIIMFRPPAGQAVHEGTSPLRTTPAATTAATAATATAAGRPGTRAATAPAPRTPAYPAPAPPPAARPPAAARPDAPAPPNPVAAGGSRRPHEPAPKAADAPTGATPGRRASVAWAVGAGTALLVLATWLVTMGPWRSKPGPGVQPEAGSPSPAAPVEPGLRPQPAAAAAPASLTAAPTSRAAAADPRPEPRSTAAGTADGVPIAASSPRPVPMAPRPAVRRPATPAEPTGATAVEPRCSDLLQRMQLGEPLTTEQTAFFQSRCTR